MEDLACALPLCLAVVSFDVNTFSDAALLFKNDNKRRGIVMNAFKSSSSSRNT